MEIREKIDEEIKIFFLKNRKNILRIQGESMYPALKEGWRAEISPVDQGTLRIGDVIVFRRKGEMAVHRIIGKFNKNGRTYILQRGDNKCMPSFIEADQVIGKVSKVFDSKRQEVSPKLWRKSVERELIIFRLLNAAYAALYDFKRAVFKHKKNVLFKAVRIFYWKLFFNLSRRR